MNAEEFAKIQQEIAKMKSQGFSVSSPEGSNAGSLKIADVSTIDEAQISPESSKPFVSHKVFTLKSIKPLKREDQQGLQEVKSLKIRVTVATENGGERSFNVGETTFNQLGAYGEKPFRLSGSLKAFKTTRYGQPFTQKWVCVTDIKAATAEQPENGATITNNAPIAQSANVTENVTDDAP